MSVTLTVKREGFIMELRRAPFEIALDGTTVGSINRDETFETPIEPGHHRLQVRAGRYSSRVQSFDVEDGDAVYFRCYGRQDLADIRHLVRRAKPGAFAQTRATRVVGDQQPEYAQMSEPRPLRSR